jgi:hypothetical protein
VPADMAMDVMTPPFSIICSLILAIVSSGLPSYAAKNAPPRQQRHRETCKRYMCDVVFAEIPVKNNLDCTLCIKLATAVT